MKKRVIIFLVILLIGIKVYSDRKKLARSFMRIKARLRLRSVKQVIGIIENKLKKDKLLNLKNRDLSKVTNLMLLAFKKERKLEFWFKENNKWKFNHLVDIKGASGKLGPKFQEGDNQVPEGIYPITFLHPNSKFNISVKLGYPNRDDIERSTKKGIKDFGGDIFIHNTKASIGCIALGELYKVEELFYICEKIGIRNCKIIISPIDFRMNTFISESEIELNQMHKKLYKSIKSELKIFKKI